MRDLLMTVFGPGVICPVCGACPGEDPMAAWFCYGARIAGAAAVLTRCERCHNSFEVEFDDRTSDLIHQPQRTKLGGVMKTVLQWRVHHGDEKTEKTSTERPR